MSSISEKFGVVVGVDTHARTHDYVIVDAATGGIVAGPESFAVTAKGFTKAIAWIEHHSGDAAVLAAVEGTGSYGRTLTETLLADTALAVAEARPASTKVRRGVGKTDGLDAVRAARSVLEGPLEDLIVPRRGDARTDLQVLLISRQQKTRDKTAQINALNAMVRTLGLLADTRKKLTLTQIRQIATGSASMLTGRHCSPTVIGEITAMAAAIIDCQRSLTANENQIRAAVTTWRPDLLERVGIGPITAARILCVWSHAGRFPTEAHFASIAGVSPVPIGSGQSLVYRLNYGGDRQLNSALHTVMLIRKQRDPRTQDYIAKRTADGKTKRQIGRLLKRYIAREVFNLLEHSTAASDTAEHPPAA